MSEVPVPYGNSKSDLERLAHFLNGFLGPELLENIPIPKHLVGDYHDFDDGRKKEWFEWAFHEVFGEAGREAAGFLNRKLGVVELNLIKRRVLNYFEQKGIKYET